jgi:hypothetical protein
MPEALKKGLDRASMKLDKVKETVGKHLESTGKKTFRTVARTHGEEQAMDPRTAKRIGAAVYGAGATGLAAAGYGAKKLHDAHKEKKSSALDELAAEAAVVKAAEAGWDVDEAAGRIGAILTLGVEDSTKIASADDLGTAVEIRSLELLETAGYPVTWG